MREGRRVKERREKGKEREGEGRRGRGGEGNKLQLYVIHYNHNAVL